MGSTVGAVTVLLSEYTVIKPDLNSVIGLSRASVYVLVQ